MISTGHSEVEKTTEGSVYEMLDLGSCPDSYSIIVTLEKLLNFQIFTFFFCKKETNTYTEDLCES